MRIDMYPAIVEDASTQYIIYVYTIYIYIYIYKSFILKESILHEYFSTIDRPTQKVNLMFLIVPRSKEIIVPIIFFITICFLMR